MYIITLLLESDGSASREGILRVISFVFALMIAVMFHELAHGYSAYAFGDKTSKEDGRLTLNPAKHFDMLGLLMMLFVGFGWAKPVRVNVNNFTNKKSGMVVVSLAGIVANIIVAFIFALLYVLSTNVGAIEMYSTEYYVIYLLQWMCYMSLMFNISFALFNILPLFPLDGYRLLSCYVRQDNAVMLFLRKNSLFILLGLLLFNYLPIIGKYSPLDLYIGNLGGIIRNAFINFWRLIV